MNALIRTSLAVTLAASVACTVQQTEVPALTGPSEFAVSLRVQATPDSVTQDGASQSSVVVTVRGANGSPTSGVALRLDIVQSDLANPGTLSSRTIVTGNDGRAVSIYTAPPAPTPPFIVPSCSPANGPSQPGGCVTISAIPIGGSNYLTASAQTVLIHLIPPGVILPPGVTPTPAFTVTPTPVTLSVPSTFDASASCGGPVVGGVCAGTSAIVAYSWNFGDGTTGGGPLVSHAFTSIGTFSVTLTVTNDRGVSASSTQTIATSAGAAPTAEFVFSPSAPAPGQQVQFNASQSRAAAGRTIVGYLWNWGDGETGTGMLQDHDFLLEGGYAVTLTVTDDVGQHTTVSRTVDVKVPTP